MNNTFDATLPLQPSPGILDQLAGFLSVTDVLPSNNDHPVAPYNSTATESPSILSTDVPLTTTLKAILSSAATGKQSIMDPDAPHPTLAAILSTAATGKPSILGSTGVPSAIVNAILTSTVQSATEGPTFLQEYGLLILIIAAVFLVILLLMVLCCFCASRSSNGNGTRETEPVLPTTNAPPPVTTRAPPRGARPAVPTQTTVTQSHSAIYANKNGQPILKTYKVVSTRSTSRSSGESVHAIQTSQAVSLLPRPTSKTSQHQQQPSEQNSTNPFSDNVPLSTTPAPQKSTRNHGGRRRSSRRKSSQHISSRGGNVSFNPDA